MKPEECPEAETLAAYIEYILAPRARRRVEAHLADCPSCRKTVALAIKSRAAVPDPSVNDCVDSELRNETAETAPTQQK
jgi:anti-sigma factor RsiW